MTVLSVEIGAATQSGALVVTEVSSAAAVRIAVATEPGFAAPVYTQAVTPATHGAHFIARVTLTGLTPETRYHVAVEHAGVLDTGQAGQLMAHPVPNTPASYTLGFIGDAGLTPASPGVGGVLAPSRLSNHTSFDQVRQRAVAEDWLAVVHLGDMHYYDLSSGLHGIVGGASVDNFRRAWSDVHKQPNQAGLRRSVPIVQLSDDHDFLGNNSAGAADPAGAAAWAQVYRERAAHYPLPSTGGAFHAQLIGRVLWVFLDCRYYSHAGTDPDTSAKTMLGAEQKAWLTQTAATTGARAIVVAVSRQFTRTSGDDTWAAYAVERAEIVNVFDALGWSGRMAMVWADRHATKIMDTQPWGGWPCMQAAPMDAAGGAPQTDYPDGLPDDPGSSHSQYGTVQVADTGEHITITMTTWRGMDPLGSTVLEVATPIPPVVPSREVIGRLVAGSHQAVIEARVVTTYQDGEDPSGVEIPVLGGDVTLDATADVLGNLELITAGDWPRRAADLLAPWGNEIFVRRGIVLDGDIAWVPLGYYAIQDPQQANAPDGEISITGLDRMSGLIAARLLAPREYSAITTVGTVVADLVREIYPAATILWDDDTEHRSLGRTIGSEDSRYELLREVADAHGKILYWDGAGYLRIESPPQASTPRWYITAGRRGGTLVSASRSLTRVGVYNAVVADGEGAGDEAAPVRAVAVDDNPNSPTYFYGRFGQVPRFYSSPLITTQAQALAAAEAMLRRSTGFPYSVSFAASPNPAVRPWDPVQLMYSDGTAEAHLMDAVTVPLDVDTPITGTTRQQTHVLIGAADAAS